MSHDNPNLPRPDDAQWVEKIREQWQPQPLDAAERERFDAELHARIEQRAGIQWWRLGWGALAMAGTVAVALLVWPAGETPPQQQVDWLTPLVEAQASLFDSSAFDIVIVTSDESAELSETEQQLQAAGFDPYAPVEYQAIAALLAPPVNSDD